MSTVSDLRRAGERPGLQTLYLTAATGLGQVALLALYALTARNNPPAEFGLVVTGIALGTAISGIYDFGSNSYSVRELATGRLSSDDFSARASYKILYLCPILMAAATLIHLTGLSPGWLIALVIAPATTLNQTAMVPLRGSMRSDWVAIALLGERAVTCTVFGAMYLAGHTTTASLWIALVAGSLSGTVVALCKAHLIGVFRWPRSKPKNPWKGSLHYGLTSASVSAQALDLPIMTTVGGPTVAGIYGAVGRWTQPMGLVVSAYTASTAPFVARGKDWEEKWRYMKHGSWIVGLGLLACIAFAVLAPLLVNALLGEQYDDSILVLRLLALGTIPALLNQPLMAFLQALGHDRHAALTMICAVLTHLCALSILTYFYGAVGASISFVAYQSLLLIALSIIFVKKTAHRRRMDADKDIAGALES